MIRDYDEGVVVVPGAGEERARRDVGRLVLDGHPLLLVRVDVVDVTHRVEAHVLALAPVDEQLLAVEKGAVAFALARFLAGGLKESELQAWNLGVARVVVGLCA